MATVNNPKNNQPSKFFRMINADFKKSTHAKFVGGNHNSSALDEYKRRLVNAMQAIVATGDIAPKDLGIPTQLNSPRAKEAFAVLRATENDWGWDRASFFKGSDAEEAELRANGIIDANNRGPATEEIEGSKDWELSMTPAQKDLTNLIMWAKFNAPDDIMRRMTADKRSWISTAKAWFRMPDVDKERLFDHIVSVVAGTATNDRTTQNIQKQQDKMTAAKSQGEGGAQVNMTDDENTGASTTKAQRMRQALLARGQKPSISDVSRQLLGDQFASDDESVKKMIDGFANDWGLDAALVGREYEKAVAALLSAEEDRIQKVRRRGAVAPGEMKKIIRTPYEIISLLWIDLVLPRFDSYAGKIAQNTAKRAKIFFGGGKNLPRTMIDGIRRTMNMGDKSGRPALQVPTDWTKFVVQFIDLASNSYFDDLAALDPELAEKKGALVASRRQSGVPAFIDADFVEALGMAWYAFVMRDIRIKIAQTIDYLADDAANNMRDAGESEEEINEAIPAMAAKIVTRAVDEVMEAYSLQSVSTRRIVDAYINAINFEYPSFPEEALKKLNELPRTPAADATDEEKLDLGFAQLDAQEEIDDAEDKYIAGVINTALDSVRRSIVMKMYNEIPEGAYAMVIDNNKEAARLVLSRDSAAREFADRMAEKGDV